MNLLAKCGWTQINRYLLIYEFEIFKYSFNETATECEYYGIKLVQWLEVSIITCKFSQLKGISNSVIW